ncbi:hypothetical protein BH11PSE5_BH11PSE5_21410 [soil metagenome]
MSAYVVVEMTVKNAQAKDRYSTAAGPLLKEHGGEFIAGGGWTVLAGESGFTNGAIIRFPDRTAALGWYNSPAYRATLVDRELGIDCRFQLIG